MRLFVAVSLPPEVVEVVRGYPRPQEPSVRWTTVAQWHVTLRFMGEVADADLDAVAGALEQAPETLHGTDPAEVRAVLGPVGAWFPGRRVLQVTVAGLDALAGAVAGVTAPWGEPGDGRPFRGHLTLARARGRQTGPAQLAGSSLEAAWSVGEVVLFSSALTPDGARYDVLTTVPLRSLPAGAG